MICELKPLPGRLACFLPRFDRKPFQYRRPASRSAAFCFRLQQDLLSSNIQFFAPFFKPQLKTLD